MAETQETAVLIGRPAHDAHVAHHFDDAQQQQQAGTLGMWAFLATEVLFFGAIFVSYGVYRGMYPDAFRKGSLELLEWVGAVNTAVLLCSSYTVVLSISAIQAGNSKRSLQYLLATIGLGVLFLAFKAFEYTYDYIEGTVPNTAKFLATGHGPHDKLYFSFYFIMTAIHALHMIIGIGLFTYLAVQTHRGAYSPEYHNPVEIGGLYWHFVDIVWIFLFPMLYLIR